MQNLVYIVYFSLGAEPSADSEAQTRLVLVILIFSPTFLPTGGFTYYVITFLDYGQHLARPWDRTLSVG
mgnify:CR=1 FL=1